jgi:hypothetical protein
MEQSNILMGGPTPMALLMFQFWIPYTLVGYQAFRYAKGQLSSKKSYFVNIIVLTAIAILLSIPLSFIPTGSTGTEDIYTLGIPLPIMSVLAFLSVGFLSPTRVEAPWTEESETVKSESTEGQVWAD